MPDTTTATSKLTRFYGELSPSLETVKQALAFAGVDTEHPRARDLYVRDIDCHNLGMHRMLQLLADAASEYGVPGPGETLLDLGCGIGGPGRFLADRFSCSVLGVDLLPLRIELAQALGEMTATTDRVSYRIADATNLDIADASFVQVWMLDVSMHVRDKRALFGEITRVLQPNGLLVMHEQTGPLPPSMHPLTRQAPYIAPSAVPTHPVHRDGRTPPPHLAGHHAGRARLLPRDARPRPRSHRAPRLPAPDRHPAPRRVSRDIR